MHKPWHLFTNTSSRGWWYMEGDSFLGALSDLGDMVQWPVSDSAALLRLPNQWHLTTPSKRHRMVLSWRARAEKAPERLRTSSLPLMQKTKTWLRKGPAAFHCNASSFDPAWSTFRHRLQVWARMVDLELLLVSTNWVAVTVRNVN